MKSKILLTLAALVAITFSTFAQSNKTIKEKLKDVKEAKKIVITTENGDITFEGDEAETLFNRMKQKRFNKMKFISDDGEFEFDSEDSIVWHSDKNKRLFHHKGKGNKMMMFMDDDGMMHKEIIKVEVEDENGEKTVTATSIKDGDKNVETYTGKEADEYLKKMESDHEMIIDMDIEVDGDDVTKEIIIKKLGDDEELTKTVEVEEKDGEKVVTVKTVKDGKEMVKVYEGKEAEKYLAKEKKSKRMRIKEKLIDGQKHKTIIIKEELEEEK